ncbi:MAG: ADP-ribosylglycohydrolase family protein [bacterium]
MAGWDRLDVMLQQELRQLQEEGYIIDAGIHAAAGRLETDADIEVFFATLRQLPQDPQYPFFEPAELDRIMKAAVMPARPSQGTTFDRIHGALVGRCIGCSLGKPLETGPYFWESSQDRPGWLNVKRWFVGAGAYPISDYVPSHSRAETTHGLHVINPACQKDQIAFMDTDDDIRYTLIGLLLLEKHGFAFDPFDVGAMWHAVLPYRFVCTAETQAYLNFAHVSHHLGMKPDGGLSPEMQDYVRTHINPYREWIGAQIRIDGYGYVAAGDPLTAARLAYQDASFSHVKNGVYGAMFFAALIAMALVEKDLDCCLDHALAVIPATSRLYRYIKRTIVIARAAATAEQLVEQVWEYLLDYGCTHTINNACCCVAAIVFAKGDFSLAVTTAVLFGLDTDCNGATVGSVMGALVGEREIPDHWKRPLNDTIYAALPDFHPIAITAVAKRFYALHERFRIDG